MCEVFLSHWSSEINVHRYIFQDLFTGGDLFAYLMYKRCRLHQAEAAVIIMQILQGLKYLHERDIVHRDLKLENVLMTSFDATGRVVISDFGWARRIPVEKLRTGALQTSRMKTIVGTPDYNAPWVYHSIFSRT